MLRGITILVVLASETPFSSQNKSTIDQWIQKDFEAVTIYREGDIPRALALLATMTLEEQEKSISDIRAQMERIAAGWPPRKEDVVPWTPRLLRALGALQMEAAIAARASTDRDAAGTAAAHVTLAKTLFAIVYFVGKEDDRAAARWLLAMGLEQMADAKFGVAYGILLPACDEHESYAPLLVACGSVTETFGSFPYDAGLPMEADDPRRLTRMPDAFETALASGLRELRRARFARNERLDAARKYFERAIALEAANTEAQLRLANVRTRQGNDRGAGEILEKLLSRPALDDRESYLARLFLARVRDHENRLDDAAATLAQAPEAQSSLIARAHNAQRRGKPGEAAALAERAAVSNADDPWWGYKFAQYWVYRDLYKQLREEARQ